MKVSLPFRVLALHGSNGHPSFLREFVNELAPGATSFFPKGQFDDGEGHTFFKRAPDFSIPERELLELAKKSLLRDGFVAQCSQTPLLAIGYSSGAIFLSALLAIAPHLFFGAILLRPQPISADFVFPMLTQPVLIISGLHDERRQRWHADRLAQQLRIAGAKVSHHILDAGHGWASDGQDAAISKDWLTNVADTKNRPSTRFRP